MSKLRFTAALLAAPLAFALLPMAPALADDMLTEPLTIATFNASLNRSNDGELIAHLSTPDNVQAQNAAETIQRVDADIILVNEFDYDAAGTAVDLFRTNYLEVPHNGAEAVEYPYAWSGPVNTGVPSGFDLNNDGTVGGPDDALGFGVFPGQYGFVVYSKYPIDEDAVRTFQNFLWKDMPGANLPVNTDGTAWYSDEELEVMPLSSKTHADIPVDVNGTTVHVLAAHPTPPAFDGPEQRNKLRNFDEIRIWADYIENTADYLYDDAGVTGGLADDANFVILGDYNSDRLDGDSKPGSIDQLLDSAQVIDPMPSSAGAVEASELQGGANLTHLGDPQYDTADFNDNPAPGNIRVDYVLPNNEATVLDSAVFWPTRDDALYRLTGEYPFPTSDHRLVWAQVQFPAAAVATETPTAEPTTPETDDSDDSTDEPTTSAPATDDATESTAPSTGGKGETDNNGKPSTADRLATTGAADITPLFGVAGTVLAAGALLLARRRAN